MNYRNPENYAPIKFACNNKISVFDERREEIAYYKKISAEELTPWVESALQALTSNSLQFESNAKLSDRLDVFVERAYVKHLTTSKTGVVVLRVKLGEQESVFRGNATSVNMWGSKSEYVAALNRALSQAASQMLAELQHYCYTTLKTAV